MTEVNCVGEWANPDDLCPGEDAMFEGRLAPEDRCNTPAQELKVEWEVAWYEDFDHLERYGVHLRDVGPEPLPPDPDPNVCQ